MLKFVVRLKRLISILLFVVYLLSATEAHQLLKLPIMVQHFIKHKEENRSITFAQFIELHYFSGNPRDADYDEDMKLPFKTADNCSANFSPVVEPTTTFSPIPPIAFITQSVQIPALNQLNPSAFVNAIFQPPKV